MTARVIQGLFIGGGPRPLGPVAQPKAQHRAPPAAPVPAFAGRAPVMQPRLPGPPAPAFAGRPPVVQRHGAGGSFPVDPGRLGLANGGGRPLPEAVRGRMEAALGADFSAVRVHVGPQAERIGAIAFTLGSDIYFAPGRFQPDTAHGPATARPRTGPCGAAAPGQGAQPDRRRRRGRAGPGIGGRSRPPRPARRDFPVDPGKARRDPTCRRGFRRFRRQGNAAAGRPDASGGAAPAEPNGAEKKLRRGKNNFSLRCPAPCSRAENAPGGVSHSAV